VSNRSQDHTLIVDDFKNINQSVDEIDRIYPDSHTPWMHGGYFNEKAQFERLQGKKLNSSVTTGGHVLTLQQLEFTDRNVLFIHQSSSWIIETDLTELMSEPNVTPLTPLEPFIF